MLLIVLVLFSSRRWALIGMMAGVLYLTQQQAIEVIGLNITAIRLLEVAGMARIAARRELSLTRFNGIDKVLILLYGYNTMVFLMRSDVGRAEMIGLMIDAWFCYFIFRGLIRDIHDLKWFLGVFAILLIPYSILLTVEMLTRQNPFALMGAATWNFELRGDNIRAMGSFRHPSLLGTLGASFLVLYVALFFAKNGRLSGFLGIALCCWIVLLSNSGGPLSALILGVLSWVLWIARKKMFWVRRALAGMLIALVLVMKAPIWYLPARVSLLTGGGGWHRSYLMDMAFQNLGLWWLAGMDIAQTAKWFPYVVAVTGAADITNNFIYFGLNGGLVTMALLIFLLIRAFSVLGQALAVIRNTSRGTDEAEYLLWGLGCVLVVHIGTWFGITYFDQMHVVWLMQLAAVSSISEIYLAPNNVYAAEKGLIENKPVTNRLKNRQGN